MCELFFATKLVYVNAFAQLCLLTAIWKVLQIVDCICRQREIFIVFDRLDEASTSRSVNNKAADIHSSSNQKSNHSDYPKGSRLKTQHHHHHHPHSGLKHESKTKRK